MRIIILALLLALPRVVAAHPVRDLVDRTIPKRDDDHVADDSSALAKDAIVVGIRGRIQADLHDKLSGPWLVVMSPMKFALGPLAIVDDPRGFAWFHGIVDVTYNDDHIPVRVSGIAVKTPAWKLAAIIYAGPLADDRLAMVADQQATKRAVGTPTFKGNGELAIQVATWLSNGLVASNHAKAPEIWAAGTAPKEIGDGSAAAIKLASSWDKLKLGATVIDARVFAGGVVGFVAATVRMPLKGDNAAEMELGAVVVKEGSSYRWVTLSFTPTADVMTGFRGP